MQCPSCGTDNIQGAAFCDNCGHPLASPPPQAANAVPPPAGLPEPIAPPAGPRPGPVPGVRRQCPVCGQENEPGNIFCDNCGAQLPAVQSAPPAPPPQSIPHQPAVNPPPQPDAPPAPVRAITVPIALPTAPAPTGPIAPLPPTQPAPAGHPRLVVAASGMYFDLFRRTEVIVGRVDPTSRIFPEVDLTAQGGDEGGVSRRHCRITLAGNQFFVEDLGSTNGTYVDASRLTPNTRVALDNGRQLRLGKLILNFFIG